MTMHLGKDGPSPHRGWRHKTVKKDMLSAPSSFLGRTRAIWSPRCCVSNRSGFVQLGFGSNCSPKSFQLVASPLRSQRDSLRRRVGPVHEFDDGASVRAEAIKRQARPSAMFLHAQVDEQVPLEDGPKTADDAALRSDTSTARQGWHDDGQTGFLPALQRGL
jgi:hypothetical protein